MRKYIHFDGSLCKLDGDVWVIEKVHTPKLGVPYKEEIGDPCPYCNRFQEDTVRRGWFRYWLYRLRQLTRLQLTSESFALYLQCLIFGHLVASVIDLFIGYSIAHFVAVDLLPLLPLSLLWYLCHDFRKWNSSRQGVPFKG